MIEAIYNNNALSFELSKEADSCVFLQFLKNTSTFDEGVSNQQLLSKLCAIGYLTVGYKSTQCSRAVVCEGGLRTGKTLFALLFKHIAEMYMANGRALLKDKFQFSNMKDSTRFVLIDDLPKNIEYLYNYITGDWVVNRRMKSLIRIPFYQSPKIIITTNTSLEGESPQLKKLFWRLKFSNYYNENHVVLDDFGKLFYSGWDISDWKSTWELIADCIRLYHKFGYQ